MLFMCGKKGLCYMRNIHELIEDLRDYGSVKGNIGILSRLDEIQHEAEKIEAANRELKDEVMKLTVKIINLTQERLSELY